MTQEPPNPNRVPTAPPSSPSRSRLQVLLRIVRQLGEIGLAFVPILLSALGKIWQLTLALLKWLWQAWLALLPRIRAVLPNPWKTRLSDPVITAIAAILLALLLWIPTALSPRAPAVASEPAEIDRPAAETAPKPNPDAERIAAIQEQLAAVTSDYREDLIQAVQANFARSRLKVNLSDGWYALDSTQQNKLANELLKRSKKLDFGSLELTNLEGTVLARSPVVGKDAVLLEVSKG